jgi:hypothetical protein
VDGAVLPALNTYDPASTQWLPNPNSTVLRSRYANVHAFLNNRLSVAEHADIDSVVIAAYEELKARSTGDIPKSCPGLARPFYEKVVLPLQRLLPNAAPAAGTKRRRGIASGPTGDASAQSADVLEDGG